MTLHQSIHSETQALSIAPLTSRVGAEIRDLRLSADLPEPVVDALWSALLTHKVLFFRGQSHLGDAAHEAFARRFGDLAPHPTQAVVSGSAAILELDSSRGGGRADQWHTDVTFVPDYPKASILRGLVIPDHGGDTIWSNTAAAYESLPAPLKALADSLRAIHSNAYDYAALRPRARAIDSAYHAEVFASTAYETEHPVVRIHPETGERSLLLGSFVQRIAGLARDESQKVFDLLQSYVTAPENTVRWRWQAGDVVIWDNRATQHYAVNDYGDAHRVVRRITLAGDVPVGLDDRLSSPLSNLSK